MSKEGKKDYHAIHKFLNTAVTIKDTIPALKTKVDGEHRHVHIHLTREDDKQAEKFMRMRGIEVESENIPEP